VALPTASDNPFPSVLYTEGTTPSSPASGKQRLYIRSSDHKVCRVDSSGTVTVVESSGGNVATDTIWDAKGDLAAGTGADTASKLTVGSNGKILVAASGQSTGLLWDTGYLGGLELVYKYTVTGSDKASIDTGTDTPDAGTNSWSSGDVLEVYLNARTDEAVAASQLNWTWNNDTGSVYGLLRIQGANTTISSATSLSRANFFGVVPGASAASNLFGTTKIEVANFTGTVASKNGTLQTVSIDTSAANCQEELYGWYYNPASPAALTRIAVTPNTSAKKLKIGSQLLIYKRRNA